MTHFGVPPIGGSGWFGGWMFMRNLVRALALHGDERIRTSVFVGPDKADDPIIAELRLLPRTQIIIDDAFDAAAMRQGTIGALLSGKRSGLLNAFARENIDVALDWATYYGWRSPIATIAWIPDFQHRLLPQLFGKAAWWKREIGFQAQIAASEAIMLSSKAAQADCLKFYPSAKGKTSVASFAVPFEGWPDANMALASVAKMGLPRDFVFLPNQLWQHKNHALAIKAAGLLAQSGTKRCIVATGRGGDPRRPGLREELSQLITTSAAQDNLVLLDGVSHKQVKALMIASNALLNPSRFEGWSTTVEEAKTTGTPMLLSDLAVHREQAPGATFFGLDDPQALCAAIAQTPVRSEAEIDDAMSKASADSMVRERAFATDVSKLIMRAQRSRSGQIAA